jgi:hypothetical protein
MRWRIIQRADGVPNREFIDWLRDPFNFEERDILARNRERAEAGAAKAAALDDARELAVASGVAAARQEWDAEQQRQRDEEVRAQAERDRREREAELVRENETLRRQVAVYGQREQQAQQHKAVELQRQHAQELTDQRQRIAALERENGQLRAQLQQLMEKFNQAVDLIEGFREREKERQAQIAAQPQPNPLGDFLNAFAGTPISEGQR